MKQVWDSVNSCQIGENGAKTANAAHTPQPLVFFMYPNYLHYLNISCMVGAGNEAS